MKHNIKWLALAMSVAAIGVSNAADTKNSKVTANASLTAGTATEANANADVGQVLSQRLSLPQVTVISTAKDGTEMVEIGLDQLDYMMVTTDANGKPVISHRSDANRVRVAEEK